MISLRVITGIHYKDFEIKQKDIVSLKITIAFK